MSEATSPRAESTAPRVEFFTRAGLTGAATRQREVLDRLDDLEATDRVAGVSTHTWEGRVRTPVDEDHEAQAVDWFDRFERWADRNDAILSPFFERNERTSEFTGEEYEELVFPVVCLAVVRDGSIEAVAPRREDGEVVDVEDCLDGLAESAPAPDRRRASPVPAGE